jgi:multisubunit Na+/H+ antiporter MnhE subunit
MSHHNGPEIFEPIPKNYECLAALAISFLSAWLIISGEGNSPDLIGTTGISAAIFYILGRFIQGNLRE